MWRMTFFLLFVIGSGLALQVQAQEAGTPATRPALKPRKLAPWIMQTIPVEIKAEETFSGPVPHVDVLRGIRPDALAWGATGKPHFSPEGATLKAAASQAVFRRQVRQLEFSFKPLRMISIDLPQPEGRFKKTLVWYMAYRVRNVGKYATPVKSLDSFKHVTYKIEQKDVVLPIKAPAAGDYVDPGMRFYPLFNLQTYGLKNAKTGVSENRSYVDTVIPLAIRRIQRREDPAIRLYNTVEISQIKLIPNGPPVWGVVTWTDIDPRTDHFSIFVKGLSNAYKFKDFPEKIQPGSPPGTGRLLGFKTLQLNFWRPGDSIYQHEDEIRYGVPMVDNNAPGRGKLSQEKLSALYGQREPLDYRWIYR